MMDVLIIDLNDRTIGPPYVNLCSLFYLLSRIVRQTNFQIGLISKMINRTSHLRLIILSYFYQVEESPFLNLNSGSDKYGKK
jgi:hypothetical protein